MAIFLAILTGIATPKVYQEFFDKLFQSVFLRRTKYEKYSATWYEQTPSSIDGLVVKRVSISDDGQTFIFRSDNTDKDEYLNRKIG
ncbi:MAG: hypothetical protein LBS77_06755, partial [Desulfovibrio sp.]|nr:hypothetical protein [Desulfovibrio sp.]